MAPNLGEFTQVTNRKHGFSFPLPTNWKEVEKETLLKNQSGVYFTYEAPFGAEMAFCLTILTNAGAPNLNVLHYLVQNLFKEQTEAILRMPENMTIDGIPAAVEYSLGPENTMRYSYAVAKNNRAYIFTWISDSNHQKELALICLEMSTAIKLS